MNLILQFLLLGAFAAALIGSFVVLRAKNRNNPAYTYGIGLALAGAFLLFWVNGAVGIIGSSDNDANMMYLGVLAVGGIAALVGRFQPHGMERAMFAMAFAQIAVPVVAMSAGMGSTDPNAPWDVVILTAIYTALWVGSALLFRKAKRVQLAADKAPESEAELE